MYGDVGETFRPYGRVCVMKRCPECDEPLFRRRAGSVEVDGCNSCGTVWLDGGEIRDLANADMLAEVDQFFRPGLQPAISPQRTNLCPVCRVSLNQTQYPGIADMTIRACGTCKGIALRDGELSRVAAHVGGTSPSPQPRASQPHEAALAAIASTHAAPSSAVSASPVARTAPGSLDDPTSTAHLPVVKGITLPSVTHSWGFFDRLARGWAFIKSAYSLAWNNKSMMAPILFGGLAGLLFLGINAGLFIAVAGTDHHEIESWFREHGVIAALWGFVVLFGQQVIRYGAMGMCVNMVDAYFKGLEPRLGTAWKDVGKNLGGIIALAFVGTIMEILISNLRDRRRRGMGGVLASAAGSLIESFWTVASYLLVPVIIVEDTGLGDGISRATRLHKGNLLQIAVGEVGINIVQGFLGFFVTLMIVALGFGLVPLGAGGVIAAVIFAVVLLALLSTVNAFTKATYYTALYLWTVDVERAGVGEPTLVPGPLAHALA